MGKCNGEAAIMEMTCMLAQRVLGRRMIMSAASDGDNSRQGPAPYIPTTVTIESL